MEAGGTTRGSERRALVTAVMVLGVPIALQSLIGSSLNMLDSVMIGSLGSARIAGVALFNWEVIVGVLRAGGDTLYSLALDLGGTWLVGLPLAAVAGLVLGAPFWAVYLLALTEDAPKCILGMLRMRSGRWLNDLTGRRVAIQ